MIKITQKDIKYIRDENTLMRFLREKLNFSIMKGTTLSQIALPLPLTFLGFDKSTSEQIIDCQDFTGLPQDAFCERRPFLIRFRKAHIDPFTLREITANLHQKKYDPSDLVFVCATENFQPFTIAYYNDKSSGSWYDAKLTVFTWNLDSNTNIHISSEHELPEDLFANVSTDMHEDESENEYGAPISTEELIEKVEKIGTPLAREVSIYLGLKTGFNRAFVIEESARDRMIEKDPKSIDLIKRLPQSNKKWKCQSKYLIWIPSSESMQWQWSNARIESEAEQIFKTYYPEISNHLLKNKNRISRRPDSDKGKFYWEMKKRKSDLYSMLNQPKIIYPATGNSMKASYDTLEGIPLSASFLLQTTDFSLLAILNSKFFIWYAAKKYYSKKFGVFAFAKKSMKNYPIPDRTQEQKTEISDHVELILDDPDSPDVHDLEEEINQLVYKLYELTPAEIKLIEEETT